MKQAKRGHCWARSLSAVLPDSWQPPYGEVRGREVTDRFRQSLESVRVQWVRSAT